MRVCKDADVDSGGMLLAELLGELNLAMDGVAFFDTAAEESNDDDG